MILILLAETLEGSYVPEKPYLESNFATELFRVLSEYQPVINQWNREALKIQNNIK